MLSQRFATKLRQARIARDLKQIDIAMALGIRGMVTVSRWEQGESFPGLDVVEKIGEFLEVPPHWFFTPDDDQAPAVTTFCEHYGPDLVTISAASWDPQPEPVNRHLKGFNFLEALCSIFVKRSFAF